MLWRVHTTSTRPQATDRASSSDHSLCPFVVDAFWQPADAIVQRWQVAVRVRVRRSVSLERMTMLTKMAITMMCNNNNQNDDDDDHNYNNDNNNDHKINNDNNAWQGKRYYPTKWQLKRRKKGSLLRCEKPMGNVVPWRSTRHAPGDSHKLIGDFSGSLLRRDALFNVGRLSFLQSSRREQSCQRLHRTADISSGTGSKWPANQSPA